MNSNSAVVLSAELGTKKETTWRTHGRHTSLMGEFSLGVPCAGFCSRPGIL